MQIAVNPVTPSTAAGVVADDVFTPGADITARVVQMLSANQVRITVGAFAYDVATTTQLEPGQILNLQISAQGDLKLAVLQPGANAGGPASLRVPLDAKLAATLMSLEPAAGAGVVSKLDLTPQEAVAVANLAQSAAARQGSLAQLFADLGAATQLQGLPPQLREAMIQVLALRPDLDENLTGDALKSAMQKSGVMMEAALASGASQASAAPLDMKAALAVFRQVASMFVQADGGAPKAAAPALTPGAANDPGNAVAGNVFKPASQAQLQALLDGVASPLAMTSGQAQASTQSQLPIQLTMPISIPATLPQQARGAVILPPTNPAEFKQYMASLAAAIAASGVAPKVDTLSRGPNTLLSLAALLSGASEDGGETAVFSGAQGAGSNARNAPSLPTHPQASVVPPMCGSLPQAQPMAETLLHGDASVPQVARQLVEDADAALARTALHQIASLPERVDAAANRHDAVPRLSFEIPFATAHGTAIAQFEISRDGEASEADANQKTWQARFSLSLEPAGPVHALVMMRGGETMVRLWAERPDTSEQLRRGARELAQALVRADLKPGDISVRDGAPTLATASVASGHFVDRAL